MDRQGSVGDAARLCHRHTLSLRLRQGSESFRFPGHDDPAVHIGDGHRDSIHAGYERLKMRVFFFSFFLP